MKKILIISNSQFGYGMGYHHQVEYLYKEFQIDLFCFFSGLSKIENDKVNVIYYPYIKNKNKYLRIIKFSIEAIKLTYKKKYDFIIVSQDYLDIFIGLFAKSKFKINYILTGDISKNSYVRKLMNFKIKLFTLPFDKIFVLSEGLKNKLKLSKGKTTVIPLGSDVIDNSEKNFNRMNLIYVGTFYNRNIDITLNGFARFFNNYKNHISMKYYIIGFGDEEITKFKKIICDNHLDNFVFILGHKNHFELREIFADCTIGVGYVPQTEFYEFQPSTKIIEYALSGLITIATNTFENRKMINENNGIICQDTEDSFYNALVEVYHKLNSFSPKLIKESLIPLTWENICNSYIVPILKEKNYEY